MKEENQKEQQKQVEIEEIIDLKNQDVKSKFEYWSNYNSSDPIKQYNAKCKSIEHGKELLPIDLEDSKEQKKIDDLYNKACDVLKSAIPDKRTTEFSYLDEGGKRHLAIKIKSGDAGDTFIPKEDYKDAKDDFILQQYQQHMGELQNIFDEIYHMLVKHEIIALEDETVDELIEDFIKNKFKDRFGIKEEKKPEMKVEKVAK